MSRLFEILSQHPERGRRIWLVVARNASEARKCVPEPYRLLTCSAICDNASGPDRLVGWAGPSLLDPTVG